MVERTVNGQQREVTMPSDIGSHRAGEYALVIAARLLAACNAAELRASHG
jgi:hypothetical protein